MSIIGTGIAKGLVLTFKHFLRPKVTISYPEQRVPTPPRFRGAPAWTFKDDGAARCVGCGTCVLACPHGVIEMETSSTDQGFRQVDSYRIHITRCLFCGLCAESCPFGALEMSSAFELARYERTDLVYTLADWKGGRKVDRREHERPAVAV